MEAADLIDVSHPSHDLCVLRRALRFVVRAGLRVADGLGQHLAQLSLRLRRFPREARSLPVSHRSYVGMLEREVNATGAYKNQGHPAIDDGLPCASQADRTDRP